MGRLLVNINQGHVSYHRSKQGLSPLAGHPGAHPFCVHRHGRHTALCSLAARHSLLLAHQPPCAVPKVGWVQESDKLIPLLALGSQQEIFSGWPTWSKLHHFLSHPPSVPAAEDS